VQDQCALYAAEEIIRAKNATLQTRPAKVQAFFAAQLRSALPAQPAAPAPTAVPLRALPDDDPYSF
jgi:hypothetical protein